MHPRKWSIELNWETNYSKGKGRKYGIMKMAIAETTYYCWKYINDTFFDHIYDRDIVVNNIKDTIIHRGWYNMKYKTYITNLMM